MESEQRGKPREVWLIEVPSQGFRWFCEEPSRIEFWAKQVGVRLVLYREVQGATDQSNDGGGENQV